MYLKLPKTQTIWFNSIYIIAAHTARRKHKVNNNVAGCMQWLSVAISTIRIVKAVETVEWNDHRTISFSITKRIYKRPNRQTMSKQQNIPASCDPFLFAIILLFRRRKNEYGKWETCWWQPYTASCIVNTSCFLCIQYTHLFICYIVVRMLFYFL